eukprot:3474223-Pleurochrysis_carterae.AAC.2
MTYHIEFRSRHGRADSLWGTVGAARSARESPGTASVSWAAAAAAPRSCGQAQSRGAWRAWRSKLHLASISSNDFTYGPVQDDNCRNLHCCGVAIFMLLCRNDDCR